MEVNLFINYYVDSKRERHRELVACLCNNFRNKEINRIIIFVNVNDFHNLSRVISLNKLDNNKLVTIFHDGRPTYNEYFIQTESYIEDINIISNTDITFEATGLQRLKTWNWKSYCLAITRWDYMTPSMDKSVIKHYNRQDSQDCWIMKGKFVPIEEADFPLGKKGCDNRIAFLLSKYYKVINPSQTIRTFHFHLTGIRNYAPHGNHEDLVAPPYKMLRPIKLPI